MIQIGYVYDSAVYYRAKYYDPSVGRFISEDPIAFSGDGNFYRYVNNSPMNGRDPWGLWSPGAHDALIKHALGCYDLKATIPSILTMETR